MKKHKILGVFIVVFSLGMIAYQATKNESSVTFFTPAEVYANPSQFEKRTFRVSGLVLEGSKKWNPSTQMLDFQMSDLNGHVFTVSYKGMPPDLFKERQGVIVEGRLQNSSAPLHIAANLLMVKHSEIYDTKEDHSEMREIKLRETLFYETK